MSLLASESDKMDEMHAQKFCIEAARCFLMYGGPAHHLEAQLEKLAQVLNTKAEFLLLPNTVFASFYDAKGGSDAAGGLHAIKKVGVLSVSHLRKTYSVYKRVVDRVTSPEIGWQELLDIQKTQLSYRAEVRMGIAFGCGAVITCLAFKGSLADAAIAGTAQLALASISIKMVEESAVIARIFELFATFLISFAARGLYSHWSHKICYSAVSSGGIVLTLPGFSVMSAALELSNKTMFSGSLKLVWAIFQGLFIGFVQTLGSNLWMKLDSSASAETAKMMEDITRTAYSQGMMAGNWTGDYSTQLLTVSFGHILDPNTPYPDYNFIGNGCYRGADWPWYLQIPGRLYLIALIPAFAFLLAVWHGQEVKMHKHNLKHIGTMVLLGCLSYTGNYWGAKNVIGAVGSVLGAFSVSFAGTVYARTRRGYAFAAMVPGVLLLVPTGLTAVGGLAQNYDSSGSDQFASGLNNGLAMIRLSIALTVGLSLASAICHPMMSGWYKFRGKQIDQVDYFAF